MNLDERPAGGRVFISGERVVRVRDRSQKSTLGTWTWDGDEPVATIRRLFESAVDARVEEAKDAAEKGMSEARHKRRRRDPTAEEHDAESRAHLQRVAPDLGRDPQRLFDLLRKWGDDGEAEGVADAERECERLCLRARCALEQGDRAVADVWWACARARLSPIGRDDRFESIDTAAASKLASEREEERRSRLLSPIQILRSW